MCTSREVYAEHIYDNGYNKEWHWNCNQAVLQKKSQKNPKLERQAMVSLDLRNLIIPFYLLKASNAFRSLKKDDVLEILCSDKENLATLLKILPSDSCELLSVKDLEGLQSGLKVRLRKSKR